MTELSFPIIGFMHSPYREKFGIPRQPNLVDVESYIEFVAPYHDILAFEGIEQFSHLWILWNFHANKQQKEHENKFRAQVRPPRLGGNAKIGVFATRSMYRPSPIGLSVVRFKQVKKVGKALRLYVTGSDLLDGTPILDIKPYIQYSDAIMDAQSAYAENAPVKKQVQWSEQAEQSKNDLLQSKKMTEQMIHEIEEVLSFDPSPAYQHDEERIYGMSFDRFNISFMIKTEIIIIEIKITDK